MTNIVPEFRSPVERSYSTVPDAALRLADNSEAAKVIVRAAPGSKARANLAQSFAGSRMSGSVLIAGTRPDEWLLIGPADDVTNWMDSLPTEGHVSVVDWTHGRAMFRLSGERAPVVLEKVCGLDWSDSMMPNGAVASGSVAKVTCDLIRHDLKGVASYLLICDRSFGQYLFDALILSLIHI